MQEKNSSMKLSLDPNINTVKAGNLTVWSHDKNSSKIMFDMDDGCGNPLLLVGAKPRILLILGKEVVQVFDLTIVSERLGQAYFVIPERILGYEGKVKASVYVDYDAKTHDLGSFYFDMKKSAIDDKMPELTFYVEEFEKAVDSMKEAESKFEESSKELNDKVTVIEKKIEENDLVTMPEVGKFDDFREQDKSLIEKMKNEFDDRGANILWYGALPDTGIPADEALRKAQESSNRIIFPEGRYTLSKNFILKNNIQILGFGKVIFEAKGQGIMFHASKKKTYR